MIPAAGTEKWMKRLTWEGMSSFYSTEKVPLYPSPEDPNTGGFVKKYSNLRMYYIMKAGHMVRGHQSMPRMASCFSNVRFRSLMTMASWLCKCWVMSLASPTKTWDSFPFPSIVLDWT